MKKYVLSLIVVLSFLVLQSCSPSAGNLSSGKIKFTVYKVISGQKHVNGFATVYFTPERIRVEGKGISGFGSGMNPNGLLIRNDKDDIILFATGNKAIKLTEPAISSYMNMMSGLMGMIEGFNSDSSNSMITFKKTGKTKKVDGYQTEQFIYRNTMPSHMMKGLPNMHAKIWMTKAVNINWGFLANVAERIKEEIGLKKNFPPNLVLKKGYFPVLVKSYRDSTLINVVKAKITAADDVESHVQISPDVKVMSFQEYFEQAFSQFGNMLDNLGNSLDSLSLNSNTNAKVNV